MHINTAHPDLNFKLGCNMYVCMYVLHGADIYFNVNEIQKKNLLLVYSLGINKDPQYHVYTPHFTIIAQHFAPHL